MNRPELANLAGDGGLYLYLPCGAAGLTFAPEPDQLLRWDPLAFAFEDISAALPPLSAVSPAADLADVNADGVLDLLVAAEDTSSALLVSQPEWSPTAPSYAASTPFGAVQASAIRFGQLDGDAWPDAAESNWLTTAVDRIFLHSGSPGPLGVPAFTVEPLGTEPGEHRNLAIADLDGDGDQDVLVAGHLANRFFANDGAAGFAELTEIWFPEPSHRVHPSSKALALADFDGDGHLDVYFARDNQDLLFYRTQADGPFPGPR